MSGMSLLRSSLCSVLTAALLAVLGSNAHSSDLDQALTMVAFVHAKIDDCPYERTDAYTEFRQATLNEVIARGIELAKFSREEAEAKTHQLIEKRAKLLFPDPNDEECGARVDAELKGLFSALENPENKDKIIEFVTQRLPWDQARPLPYSSTGAKSYIYDNLIPIFAGTIKTHWSSQGQAECEGFDVINVETVEANFVEMENLPFFVQGPKEYWEHWTVRCRNHSRVFGVAFGQSSVGPIGRYIVKEVTE